MARHPAVPRNAQHQAKHGVHAWTTLESNPARTVAAGSNATQVISGLNARSKTFHLQFSASTELDSVLFETEGSASWAGAIELPPHPEPVPQPAQSKLMPVGTPCADKVKVEWSFKKSGPSNRGATVVSVELPEVLFAVSVR
jgi:hypothetical protein